MKKTKDRFSYGVGWGCAGISCSFCKHSLARRNEDTRKVKSAKCTLYNISLNIRINEGGHIEGEYFCKNFTDKNAFPQGLEEFNQMQDELEENVLYRAIGEDYLKAIPFKDLPE